MQGPINTIPTFRWQSSGSESKVTRYTVRSSMNWKIMMTMKNESGLGEGKLEQNLKIQVEQSGGDTRATRTTVRPIAGSGPARWKWQRRISKPWREMAAFPSQQLQQNSSTANTGQQGNSTVMSAQKSNRWAAPGQMLLVNSASATIAQISCFIPRTLNPRQSIIIFRKNLKQEK